MYIHIPARSVVFREVAKKAHYITLFPIIPITIHPMTPIQLHASIRDCDPTNAVTVILLNLLTLDPDGTVASTGPVGILRSIVLVPIISIPPDSRPTGVPDIVRPGPPAIIFVPSIKRAVGVPAAAVKVCPAMVKTGGGSRI